MNSSLTHKLILLLLLLCLQKIQAQDSVDRQQKILLNQGAIIRLDSLSIIPSSVYIQNNILDTNEYYLDAGRGELSRIGKSMQDSVVVRWRSFPIDFSAAYYNKDISLLQRDYRAQKNPFKYGANSSNPALINLPGLDKNGSISRGIAFGNNQNLTVNSNLNLQLAGKVNDRISIAAAVTDDNIPIQPEGNTAQLQDFDQIYIQFFDDHSKLIAGDYQLKSPENHFLRYNKRAQGGSFSTQTAPLDGNQQTIQISGAVSKGKFARNIIQGVEGNQGPYRLVGAEKERFIIVLAGTERVYIDGKLLKRGKEHNYVIDYNTAEITFTANSFITKDKRIIVEFQYSDKNYARSLIQFRDQYKFEKGHLEFNFFSEQDAKSQPLQQELSTAQKTILANAGDHLDAAVSSSVRKVEFSESEVLYKAEVDSLTGDTIYVHSTNLNDAFYRITFSFVGAGNGSYNQEITTINGKIYAYVGRLNGQYQPTILLMTPKKKQMMTIGGSFALSDQTKLTFQSALSNHDLNTFSDLDRNDNLGHAIQFQIENRRILNSDTVKPAHLITKIGYEQVASTFERIERFRSVEFDRDWNTRDFTSSAMLHLPTIGLSLEKKQIGHVSYELSGNIRDEAYQGYRNSIIVKGATDRYKANSTSSIMHATGQLNESQFIRNNSIIARKSKWFQIGLRDDFERNKQFLANTDSLLGNSYDFLEWEAFITTPDSSKNKFSLGYIDRIDQGVANNMLARSTHGKSLGLAFELLQNPKSKLKFKSTYRILSIENDSITSLLADSTLLNRIEYNLSIFKGTIRSTSFYEIGSGLEVKKEFTFLEVAAGQGTYIHTDYNDNGEKEISEFEIAPFQYEANYIKIFTPTNEYVKVYSNEFNQLLYLQPRQVWANKKGVRKFMAKFSDQLAIRIKRKTGQSDFLQTANPFYSENVNDTALISLNSSFRNSLYFNKSHPKFGLDFNHQQLRNKILLTNGFDSRTALYNDVRIRWNISNKFLLNSRYRIGIKTSGSEYASSRNYFINYYEILPELSFQPTSKFRLTAKMEYKDKLNQSDDEEQAIYQLIGLNARVNTVGKGSFLSTINLIQISYDYPTNNSLAFEMLEGLQPGENYTWQVSYQRTLANNLQINLNYNGRKSGDNSAIHTGGIQVRAFF